jgi:ribosomal protein S18 acetylase RimI-like enzyme
MVAIRRATRDDTDACAAVLARAFHDDPGTVLYEPDEARRAEVLPQFFRTFVAASLDEDGHLVVAGDPVNGIAIWFGPERHGPSPDAMGANGFGDVLTASGPEASQRLLAMVGELEAQHERLTDGAHLRLDFFGVDPTAQGSGIGSALIEHGHRRADELGIPCYLDTFTQENVRFYGHRGYELAGEFTVGDGVPVYGLIRPPKQQESARRASPDRS